jgi:integrase
VNVRAQKHVGCHDLRHSCAAVLFAAGVPATKVAAVLRHTTTRRTLTTYAGLAEADRGDLRRDLEAAFR